MSHQFWGVNIGSGLPSVVGGGVALPTDMILFFLLSAIVAPSNDPLHFPFRFSIDDIRRRLNEVSPVFGSFSKWGKVRCVEHIVDLP